jgi:hypothetical protein
MVKQGMTRACAMTACLLAATTAASAQAAEPSHGMRVTEALAFDKTFEYGIMICHEKMAKYDLDSAIKTNPQLLGGIQRGEPEFAEAEAAATTTRLKRRLRSRMHWRTVSSLPMRRRWWRSMRPSWASDSSRPPKRPTSPPTA